MQRDRLKLPVVQWAALAVVVGLAVSGGCGDDEQRTYTFGTTSSGAGGGSSGTSSGAGATDPGQVVCSDMAVCSGDEVCCFNFDAANGRCAADCAPPDAPVSCDGPEDCEDNACCGNISEGYSCAEEPQCPDGVTQRCHGPQDCPASARCVPTTVAGLPVDACAEVMTEDSSAR